MTRRSSWRRPAGAARGLRLAALVLVAAACAEAQAPGPEPLSGAGALAIGGRQTFAIRSHSCARVDGGVQCWGAAERGQTGDGSLARRRPLPVRVPGLGEVRAVAAGGAHTCVLGPDGVSCFGDNSQGQGGTDRPLLQLAPTPVPGLPPGVVMLAAGLEHSCAATPDRVFCWGRNESGEAGRAPGKRCREPFRVRRCSLPPSAVEGVRAGVTALALGARHSCALADGEVFCWGADAASAAPRHVAARVQGLPGRAAGIASGWRHTCALVDGAVFCWGGGVAEPTPVPGLPAGVQRLAAGGDRSCVAAADGVWCWAGESAPRRVPGVGAAVRALAVGPDHACALEADAVRCWGGNGSGQLGSGTSVRSRERAEPVAAWDRGRLRDVDGDGRLTLVCLGDSNTERMPGAAPPWCDRLAPLLPPGFRVVNRGLGGATASPAASLLDASAPIAYALENDAPDVAVLAYGSNDVLAQLATAEIVAAIARHARRLLAEGVTPLVALVPPLRSDDVAANRAVQALNDALRETFPAEQLVDFFSGVDDAALLDRVHLGDAGQARRARVAAEVIVRLIGEPVP